VLEKTPWIRPTSPSAAASTGAVGVTYPDGRALPNDELPARAIAMGRMDGILAYPNFAAYTDGTTR